MPSKNWATTQDPRSHALGPVPNPDWDKQRPPIKYFGSFVHAPMLLVVVHGPRPFAPGNEHDSFARAASSSEPPRAPRSAIRADRRTGSGVGRDRPVLRPRRRPSGRREATGRPNEPPRKTDPKMWRTNTGMLEEPGGPDALVSRLGTSGWVVNACTSELTIYHRGCRSHEPDALSWPKLD